MGNEDNIRERTFLPDTNSYTINGVTLNQKYLVCVETLLNTTALPNVLRSCDEYGLEDKSPNILLLAVVCVCIVIVIIIVFVIICIVMKRQQKKKFARAASQRTLLTDDGRSLSTASSMNTLRKAGVGETSSVDAPMPMIVQAGQVKLMKGTGKVKAVKQGKGIV